MRRNGQGNVLLLTALSMPLLFALLAFGADAVLAIEAKAAQESALQTVQELRMAPAITLRAKNANDPGAVIAQYLMGALRNEGYEGAVAVWFYEAGPADGLADESRRVYAYEVEAADRVPTAFARLFGADAIDVSSSFSTASQPYAEFAVWRPAATRCGVYRIEAGESPTGKTFSAASLADMPEGIRGQIGEALATPPNGWTKE